MPKPSSVNKGSTELTLKDIYGINVKAPKNKLKDQKKTKRVIVYEQGKDIFSVLHNIAQDLREADNQKITSLGIPYKDGKNFFSINVHGSEDMPSLEIKINELVGGLRVSGEDSKVLLARAKDTLKLLEKLERAIKKEFKKRTGKTLYLTKENVHYEWEPIALNGLYRFFARKLALVKVKVQQNEYGEPIEVKD